MPLHNYYPKNLMLITHPFSVSVSLHTFNSRPESANK